MTSFPSGAAPFRTGLGSGSIWTTVLPGVEIPLGADLLGGVDGPGSSAIVTITPTDPSSGQDSLTEQMVIRGGRWETRLSPLPPGLYEVSVEVKDTCPVYDSAPLAVVEQDEELVPDGGAVP